MPKELSDLKSNWLVKMKKNSSIVVAGSKGMVGSAIIRNLEEQGYENVHGLSREDCDFLDGREVKEAFWRHVPQYLFIAAAKVGGIGANNEYPADFIYENMMINANIFHMAKHYNVKKIVFLGSSCIYPKLCPQPIKEEYLLSGPLEPTNDAYAIAKIAGVKLCQAYSKQYDMNCVPVMPTNLYGPGDKYDKFNSHVIPAMIMKFVEAQRDKTDVWLWGTGTAQREFMHVDDCARACIHAMEFYDSSKPLNIGSGDEWEIREVAELIKDVLEFKGKIHWNTQMPDGTPLKFLDSSKLRGLGFDTKHELGESMRDIIEDYLKNHHVPTT